MNESEQERIFAEWLGQHKGLLFKVTRSYAFSDPDREDLFQEIAAQVWRSIPAFQGDSKVTTWIYRVALFTAVTWTRQEDGHREGRQPLDGIEHVLTEPARPHDGRLAWLYGQIEQLSPIDRSLMLLLLDGFSYQEMAAMLGISETNVGVKVHRIKKRLAHQFQEVNKP